MKVLRAIVSDALINELGLNSIMLSRIEGDKPICIELKNGTSIFISFLDDSHEYLVIWLEIPCRDQRVLQLRTGEILDKLHQYSDIHFKIENKIASFVYYIEVNSPSLNNRLITSLVSLNTCSSIFPSK